MGYASSPPPWATWWSASCPVPGRREWTAEPEKSAGAARDEGRDRARRELDRGAGHLRLGTGGERLVVGAGRRQVLTDRHRPAVRGDGHGEGGEGVELAVAAVVGADGVTAGTPALVPAALSGQEREGTYGYP